MADILPFEKPAAKKLSETKSAKKNTLCLQGHHKWRIVTEQKFDVKQGKLVTLFECVRCQKKKVKSL